MSELIALAIGTAVLAVAWWAVPAVMLRVLEPRFRRRTVPNFRGREVYLGLGWAWVAWAGAVLAMRVGYTAFIAVTPRLDEYIRPGDALLLATFEVPLVLTLGAFFFGWLDDVRGTSEFRGFRGHLRALSQGRLTTGLLKLVGVGSLSVVFGGLAATSQDGPLPILWPLCAIVIAGSANLLNLFDLRPGRAVKAYLVLAILAILAVAPRYGFDIRDPYPTGIALGAAVLLLGPALAIWPYDLGERGMLGDAGANAAGALVGYMLALNLSTPLLAVAAVVLVALNLASERVSFSAVIERTPALRALDRLGRLPEDSSEKPSAESV